MQTGIKQNRRNGKLNEKTQISFRKVSKKRSELTEVKLINAIDVKTAKKQTIKKVVGAIKNQIRIPVAFGK